ncbi:hypothetical protein SLA2020_356290 [Shorea laevis]
MQCSDPDFKRRHHRRRVMLKPLVDLIMKTLMLVQKEDATEQDILRGFFYSLEEEKVIINGDIAKLVVELCLKCK